MKIAFLVWDVGSISGGLNAVIEHAAGLQKRGHQVTLVPTQPAANGKLSWHPALPALTVSPLGSAISEPFDFVFATWWTTYFELGQFDSRVYGYFNQSLESRFYSDLPEKFLNRLTYALPVFFVTEARWLEQLIRWLQPSAEVFRVRNGLSEDFFPCVANPPPPGKHLRVLLEGTHELKFKGVEEAVALLEEASTDNGLEVAWLTANSLGYRPLVRGVGVEVYEQVPIGEVRHVLRQFDVMLKLSRVEGVFGPPLEMFSQGGTAIAYGVSGSDEYMTHGFNSLLAEPFSRNKVVAYLRALSESSQYLQRLRSGALETARHHPSWSDSALELCLALEAAHARRADNRHLRPSLHALWELRMHYLDLLQAAKELAAEVGQGERTLLRAYRRLKSSAPFQSVQRLLPPSLRSSVRDYFERLLS